MSFQSNVNRLIGAAGGVVSAGSNALEGNANKPEANQAAVQAATPTANVVQSNDDKIREMANKLANNLIVSKEGQMQQFKTRKENLAKLSSSEWFDLAVDAEKRKNKDIAEAYAINAYDREKDERSGK